MPLFTVTMKSNGSTNEKAASPEQPGIAARIVYHGVVNRYRSEQGRSVWSDSRSFRKPEL
jgi:hypothetical protein